MRDSFVIPESPSSPSTDDGGDELSVLLTERSESFQTIVKRHHELASQAAPAAAPPPSNPAPLKRPGILKKPKDWSSPSPSPQEVPSPVVATTTTPLAASSTSSTSSTSSMMTMTSTTTSQQQRKPSIESTIEIQLNPSQSSSIVVHEIPADRRDSAAGYSTIQYNSVQDVKVASSSQMPRKLSIDVEPSPTMHTSSVTLPTGGGGGSTITTRRQQQQQQQGVASTSTSVGGLVLSGDNSGHSIRSTSTFQLSKATNNKQTTNTPSTVTAIIDVSSSSSSSSTGGSTKTESAPWRRGSSSIKSSAITSSVVTSDVTNDTATSQQQNNSSSSINATKSTTSTINYTPTPPMSNRTTSVFPSQIRNQPPTGAGAGGATSSVSTESSSSTSTVKLQRTPSLRGVPSGSSGVSSVRALAQKFITTSEEKSLPQVSKSQTYPKAGLIFRSNSFRSNSITDADGGPLLNRTGSLRGSRSPSRFVPFFSFSCPNFVRVISFNFIELNLE